MMRLALLTTTMLATTVPGTVIAQTPANPVTDAGRELFPEHERNILGSFRLMPESKYGFRPTPELMTFGELAGHIAVANFYYCRALQTAPRPAFARPQATDPKETLVKLLELSFAYCRTAVETMTDARLAETVPVPQSKPVTLARMWLELLSGMDHHYGQAAGYLRLNGLVPPSAMPPKH